VFLGHYAVALGAKRLAPRSSLGVLIAAAQLPDLLWPLFLLAGWEQVRIEPGNTAFTPLAFTSYPISHSLLYVVGWGAVLGLIVHMFTRRLRDAVLAAALVVSHWLLDFVTHRPDLPLYPGGPLVGLGLWNHVAATIVIESILLVVGLGMYLRQTRERGAIGRYGLWSLLALLVLIYAAGLGGSPPGDVVTLAWFAMIGWLVVFWAAWSDRHRSAWSDRTRSARLEPASARET
jgi:hypothetical protein